MTLLVIIILLPILMIIHVFSHQDVRLASGEIDGSGIIVDNDNDDDGVCDIDELEGCTDEIACNYDATPTTDTDNDLCIYSMV